MMIMSPCWEDHHQPPFRHAWLSRCQDILLGLPLHATIAPPATCSCASPISSSSASAYATRRMLSASRELLCGCHRHVLCHVTTHSPCHISIHADRPYKHISDYTYATSIDRMTLVIQRLCHVVNLYCMDATHGGRQIFGDDHMTVKFNHML